MRYAVVSDIHGNLPALRAVLRDAAENSVNRLVFLGDYVGDLPWPCEVVQAVRALEGGPLGAVVLGGNKEEYLDDWWEAPRKSRVVDQYAAIYWNVDQLGAADYAYLSVRPKALELEACGYRIFAAHRPETLLGETAAGGLSGQSWLEYAPEPGPFHSLHKEREAAFEPGPRARHGLDRGADWRLNRVSADGGAKAGASRGAYLAHAQRVVGGDAGIRAAADGVYLFGHYHTQWHARVGGTLLVNPGSAGLPLDGDVRAPYTILEFGEGGVEVLERRVPYDVEEAVLGLRNSSMYRAAPLWSEINVMQLRSARGVLFDFFDFIGRMARERGEAGFPFSNHLWAEAGVLWLARRGRGAADS